MGFNGRGKRPRGRGQERREPSLFGNGGGAATAGARSSVRPHAASAAGGSACASSAFSSPSSSGRVFAGGLGFGYVWITLDQKGLFQIPAREPGIMVLASDGDVLAERGAFFGDEVRVDESAGLCVRRRSSPSRIAASGRISASIRWASSARDGRELRAGRVVQGGSTLTQQLAKNLFLKPDRTMARKAQEAVLAMWLEQNFSKDEILQLYINRVYFGAGATGIEKAAQKFFGKSARDVTLAEAAILAAVLKAPSDYNPVNHPDARQARAPRASCSDMVEAGFIDARRSADGGDLRSGRQSRPPTMCRRRNISSIMRARSCRSSSRNYDQSIVV